jgi:hypothetical protein
MNFKKLLLGTVVVGVVANILDWIVHGMILQGAYYSQMPSLFRQDVPMGWFIFGDFVFALVFIWVYDRVWGSFGGGTKGGATYGFYTGVLCNFPMWLYNAGMYVGFPYALSWIWVIWGIVWMVILGAVAGAVYKREAAPAMAAT